jgi:hypothetical protein
MFIVTGVKVDRKDISNEDFIKEINEFLNDYEDHQDNNASKYFAGSEYTIISSGEIFYDWYLDPNETARRSAIFFVPKNKYDLIEISTFIPVVNRNGVAVGKWRIDSKGEEIFFDLYKRVVRNGKEEFVDADDDFEFQEEIDFSIIDGYESYPVGRNNQNQSNKTGYDNSVTAPPSLRAYPSRSLKWIIKKN